LGAGGFVGAFGVVGLAGTSAACAAAAQEAPSIGATKEDGENVGQAPAPVCCIFDG